LAKQVLRFFRENPVAIAFGGKFIGFAIFGIGWYHGVNFKLEDLENRVSTQSIEIKALKEVIETKKHYPKSISMVIADREDRLKRCNQDLSRIGAEHNAVSASYLYTYEAFNRMSAHHKRCVEREKSIRYANSAEF
jgi:hypothetical protein